jgi:nucleoside-diphosphate-sugar epimerase
MRSPEPTTIAITGATGFIGCLLARYHLDRGHQVRVLSRQQALELPALSGAKHFQGDITLDIPSRFLEGVDTLYHLAAELGEPSKMYSVNVNGTSILLAAAITAGLRRWVQLSSVGVYGPPTGPTVTEATPPVPTNEYERTKLASDVVVETTCKRNAVDYAILRPSNVIGATMKNRSFFALVSAVKRGRFFYIGPRGAIATYVHVDDVVQALIACASAPSGGIYNISSDCTWEVLIDRISELTGVRPPRLRIPSMALQTVISLVGDRIRLPLTSARLASLTNRSRYPTDRITSDLGFRYCRPMPDGIQDIVKAMR